MGGVKSWPITDDEICERSPTLVPTTECAHQVKGEFLIRPVFVRGERGTHVAHDYGRLGGELIVQAGKQHM